MLILAACPPAPPRYIPKAENGLPTDPAAGVALSDALVANKPRTLENLSRARAALLEILPKHKKPYEVRWRLARVCFLLASQLKNKGQLVETSRAGMRQAELATKAAPERVEGHYYLALNMARVAEAKWKITYVKPMVAAGERARKIDEGYDDAGPLVFLGKVYLTAPAWPVSVGNTEKAVELLEAAVKKAPRPLTRLFLGQAYLEEEEYTKAKKQLELALAGKLEERWRKEAEQALARVKKEL